MDFIDWCHYILRVLEKEKYNSDIDDYKLPIIIFGEEFSGKNEFHLSKAQEGIFQALKSLSDVELVKELSWNWKITPLGKEVLFDPIEFWASICQEKLDSEEEQLLRLINKLSQQPESNPDYIWLKDEIRTEVLENLEIGLDHIDELQNSLAERDFLKVDNGYYLTPTYKGLVWGARRDFTIESKFIDELVKEWETTNVDFKQELSLKTEKQKAEFAKDILGLANTKSSGKRYLIIGFNDKTREYHAPPDTNITQEIMERHLVNLTEPMVNIRYKIINYKQNKVGKLEVIRDPKDLPYRAKKDVFIDERRKKGLEKNKIYVRHGSHTESPTEFEEEALKEEGKQARGES